MPAKKSGQPAWLDPELATLTKDRFSDPAWLFERKLDGERCLAFSTGAAGPADDPQPEGGHQQLPRDRRGALADPDGPATSSSTARSSAFAGDADQLRAAAAAASTSASPGAELLRPVPGLLLHLRRPVRRRPGRPAAAAARAQELLRRPARRSATRCGSPSTGTPTARRTTREACRQGWEGLIAKRADAPYRAGRSRDWLKFKCETDQEFVIGGFTDPQRLPHRVRRPAARLLRRRRPARLRGQGRDRLRPPGRCDSLHERAGPHRAGPPAVRARATCPGPGVHWVEPRLVGAGRVLANGPGRPAAPPPVPGPAARQGGRPKWSGRCPRERRTAR